ncbi:hypothetical protein SAMN05720766_1205 [Fibrobacter sp. UWH9]|uniref:restriction endonuclease subunit S n=1 Tax=Fibrobacter sp. UWH9 TaxID=1896213 RepID=UPI00091A76EE|nr:restriction endonuclease subunit S [Fibrobacter sp. UWH9]SHH70476.1 hypothetical protein SAMN05720766_1205 [Fibrobacter sp. UWH9]
MTKFTLLSNIATIRTGVVTTRKKAAQGTEGARQYNLLNLRCVRDDGRLDLLSVEPFAACEELADSFITRAGDILVRLSAPYTSVIIEKDAENLLVPSHFAIIRLATNDFDPHFILWQLRQKNVKQTIYQNVSGTTQFGTINSGLFGSIPIEHTSLQNQRIFSELFKLAEREHDLLENLAAEKMKFNQALMAYAFKSFK